ncbi:MAG: UvrD-helicase domain-containing protein [Salinivirgaceae bacterium]|nr:UvrD-helicase domain-containing protein [Salinivirgaceae bacterium]
MQDFLNDLSDVQRQAVVSKDGPCLIVAGAGSGKTRVLTYRIAYLLNQGVAPWNILALTFTNKAAREMKNRISALVGAELADKLVMGTFHSIFSRILRVESDRLGYPSEYTIYDTTDSKNLIKSIVKGFEFDEKQYKSSTVLNRISMAKNNLYTAQAYARDSNMYANDNKMRMPMIGRIYLEYASRCRTSAAMDFDDLLLNTNVLFRDNPDILEKYQNKFKYVLVDEYQDTNFAQYLIIRQLCKLHNNICVVGDDAQSIYSFRGAKIENILNFQKDYPQHRIFKLEQNYRSTQTIVDAANCLIEKNVRRIPKTVFSENDEGAPIKIFEVMTEREEANTVVMDIYNNIVNKHITCNDVAILYRTNAQSRVFEEALRKRNMAYQIYGGTSFYQRKEIKDIIAYLRLVVNPDDGEALKRVINYPSRKIGEATIDKIENAANNMHVSIWQIISQPNNNHANLPQSTLARIKTFVDLIKKYIGLQNTLDAYDLARQMIDEVGIKSEFDAMNNLEDQSRLQNIEELLNAIMDYTAANGNGSDRAPLSGFLQNVALLTDQDTNSDEQPNSVTMMTIHAAKGLEFPYVYIVGLEENLFPSSMAEGEFGIEEERRLLYVAITRAKTVANLSFCHSRSQYGQAKTTSPSRFLKDIDPQYMRRATPAERSGFGVENADKFQPRRITQSFSQAATNKLKQMHSQPTHQPMDFAPSDAGDIKVGMSVEHVQFGIGKVLKIDSLGADFCATIFFPRAGEKRLILKYAKLRIVE